LFDIGALGLSDMVRLSAALRRPADADTMEGAARSVVRYLYETLLDKETGEPSCALVRLYKTHPYAGLDPDLQAFAGSTLPDTGDVASLRCLTLLASAGIQPAWNDRRSSVAHRAIPLPVGTVAERSPMVHRLLADLGLDLDLGGGAPGKPYNVFHVAEALGSPYVPAQDDFVVPYGIRSVVGFGGLLPDGELFAVILFSRTPISRECAEQFGTVTMSVGLALVPFVGRIFDGSPAGDEAEPPAEWRAMALEQLVDVREGAVLEQSLRLEQALAELEDRAAELDRSRTVLTESEARKAAILEASLDGIVTVGADGVIVEFNPAAERLFGLSRDEAVGSVMASLLVPPSLRAAHHAGFARHLLTGESTILGSRVEVPALHSTGYEIPVELSIVRIDVAGPPMFTAYIRDLTRAKRVEAELRELADTLQAGLLPPRPPVIAGMDIATHYRAGGAGVRVGGDFYDVFRLGEDEWGVVIGDVCGKGAKAASVTALVRHTARAAAAHSGNPGEVMHEINAALADGPDADDRYCSAVFARLAVSASGADVVACGGGHPSPIVVRASGGVEPVPTGGQLVGLFEEYESACVDLRLAPGDALVLYTDGVTEARNAAGELFGEERLAALLAGHPGAPARTLVEAVVAGLAEWTESPGDDVALVALRAAP
jgi:sigma-B regulation protein RsbU (phosphoserine phosphatase)